MRMNRRDFIKTTGVLGACACCGLPGFTQRSDFSTEPFTHKSQFPTTFQIDAGNICQLDCPECPAKILMRRHPGYGFLKFKNFKKFIDNNKNITDIELSKTGEIFLNPELLDIIKYAHKKNVSLTADNGVNGNYISDEVLEALVKYKFKLINFSIDGASQKVYSIYRRGGDFDKVIDNIKRINTLKAKYNSEFPKMNWKYVVFGHNVCDMVKAKQMAQELGMSMYYAANCSPGYSPIRKQDEAFVKKMYEGQYLFDVFDIKTLQTVICADLFKQPQIHYDGRFLGCSCNSIGFYNVNAFETDLMTVLNNPDYLYSKKMLTGQVPDDKTNPCSDCWAYNIMQEKGSFICA